MTSQDLENLHRLLNEAERVMASYRPESATLGTFALQCEEYGQLLMLELNAFAEIVERTKKGEM